MRTAEVLIIGQGLAGTLLSYHLVQKGVSVIVADEVLKTTSSRVAAGMYNPISPRRMNVPATTAYTLPFAIDTYTKLEKLLQESLLNPMPIYQVFGSVKEQNDLMSKPGNGAFRQYIDPDVPEVPHLLQPFGAFGISNTGWVNTGKLIDAYRDHLASQGAFAKTEVHYDRIGNVNGTWQYEDISADKIVFCEGYKAVHNPFFPGIRFSPAKGDVLTIACEGLERKQILKKGVYIVPVDNGLFKVGATYRWDTLDPKADEDGRRELEQKLDEMLDIPYTVISHECGIRPATSDRQPVLGRHSSHDTMFMFNGLGTRGVMLGPYFAHLMSRLVTDGSTEIPKEVSLERFSGKK